MTTKSRKRSAASEVLHKKASASKVVLSSTEASVPAPDHETKSKKPVRLTRARAASIRRAIETKSPVSAKKEKAPCDCGVFGNLSFATGKIVGKTSSLLGKLASAVKKN